MNSLINISFINQSNTYIFVLPANNRQDLDDFKYEDVSLTWQTVQIN